MCLFTNASEACNHPECMRLFTYQNRISMDSSNIMYEISSLIHQQTYELSNLLQQNFLLNQKLEKISLSSSHKTEVVSSDLTTHNIFQRMTLNTNYRMFIQLEGEFPEKIYKEKGFDILLAVLDQAGQHVYMPGNTVFTLSLYTLENPPKLLKTNISGKRIMRGTSESIPDVDGKIRFRNIVINEVSSHYPSNSFCLVIFAEKIDDLKPLIMSGIVVRARKHKK